MYREIYVFLIVTAYFLLIVHSSIFRGSKKTLTFFGTAYVFGLVREILYANFVQRYFFTGIKIITIFDVPVGAPLGWTFSYYLGLFFAQKILNFNTNLDNVSKSRGDKIYEEKILPLILIASMFGSAFSLAIETFAIHMEWWDLNILQESVLAPAFLFFGWFGSSFLFLNMYVFIQYKAFRQRKLLLLIINFLMLNIFFELEIMIFAIIFLIPFLFFYKDLLKVEIFFVAYMVFTYIVLYAYHIQIIDQVSMHLLNIPIYFGFCFLFCLYFIEKYRTRKLVNKNHPLYE